MTDLDVSPVTYIAGPMTGIENFNYPAFHSAERYLKARADRKGNRIINPARNFNGEQTLDRNTYLQTAFKQVIDEADEIVALPGWESSIGARTEVFIGLAMGLDIVAYRTMMRINDELFALVSYSEPEPVIMPSTPRMRDEPETILEEAQRLVHGDRQQSYGHPYEDFSRTAQIWSAILGHPITPSEVSLCMVGVKVSREVNQPKRDNRVDGAGYFATLDMVREREAELYE